ncbi:MAG: DNA repair protein RecO [Bacteroidales bacterium]
MFEKTKGIVLNIVEYSDKASIVNIYTMQFGRLSFTLPASRSKKASLKRNLFQPLSVLELELDMKPGRTIHKIKEARPGTSYQSIPFHPVKSAVALFLAEVLVRYIHENESNPALFDFLENSFLILDLSDGGIANFHPVFLYGLLGHLGIAPRINRGESGYFIFGKGEVQCDKPGYGAFLNQEETSLLVYIAGFTYAGLSGIRLNRIQRNMLTNSLLEYMRYHLNINVPVKSLEVLQMLFE